MYYKEMNFEEIKEELKRKFEEELTKLELQFKEEGTKIIDYIDVDLIVEEIKPVLLPITFENIDGHDKQAKYRAWKYFWERAEDIEKYLNAEFGVEKDDLLESLVLSYDYVEPGTFDDQKEGYYRIQFSWGGPSDELRIYTDKDKDIERIEYVFLDWYIGIGWDVTDEYPFDYFVNEVFDLFFWDK